MSLVQGHGAGLKYGPHGAQGAVGLQNRNENHWLDSTQSLSSSWAQSGEVWVSSGQGQACRLRSHQRP